MTPVAVIDDLKQGSGDPVVPVDIKKVAMSPVAVIDDLKQGSGDLVVPVDMKKVAIIGGAGNIGSYLADFLRSRRLEVTVYDKNPQIPGFDAIMKHSESITKEDMQVFGMVIFLGGCTGRRACAALSTSDAEKENVHNVVDLVKKLGPDQYFVTASTSAVSEGTENAKEIDLVHEHLLDEYSSTMWKREKALRYLLSQPSSALSLPRVSLLRFGTVIGISRAQRTDLAVPSFFKAAYSKGVLQVQAPEVSRSFLHIDDLSRAVHALVLSHPSTTRFHVWNLASFHATILKLATTISSITGATIDVSEEEAKKRLKQYSPKNFSGFSINPEAFSRRMNFSFKRDLLSTLIEFDKGIPDDIIAKGPHAEKDAYSNSGTIACPVCGARDQQNVLDLTSQPSANDMREKVADAMASPRYPLRLVRCRVCNHYHLSHVVDRRDLFQSYLYQSGTSTTLANYFEWLAKKVVTESGLSSGQKGSILEIACNDGSQLDHYKQFGWGTYGVDPAANLVKLAAEKGHIVKNGFWPTEFPELPPGDALTAITAQNVAAHVPDVVAFLRGCVKVMGPKTILYIQTSQCNMQQLGQFDTVYHEHISFFTGHSFLKASQLAGLYITSFETTPIHGESCLVTMKLKDSISDTSTHSPTLAARLAKEVEDGITHEFYATKFSTRAKAIRDWVKRETLSLVSHGYVVGAYAAAAKGMVLLHFMLDAKDGNGTSLLQFVLDDAPLKQSTYCPGTAIPVYRTQSIRNVSASKPLALLVFAWNFYEEIAQRVRTTLAGFRSEVLLIVPFPSPKLIKIKIGPDASSQLLRGMPYYPTPIPNTLHNSSRREVVLLTHERNEAFLMPYWIMQHAPMFDRALIIDYESNDETRAIIDKLAPPSWRVVNSSTGKVFMALDADEQILKHEQTFGNAWVLALTVTEFLVKSNLRHVLHAKQKEYGQTPSYTVIEDLSMYGYETEPLTYLAPLPKQRTGAMVAADRKGFGIPGVNKGLVTRFMHTQTFDKCCYGIGRHDFQCQAGVRQFSIEDAFIMKWKFSPWPEIRLRKTKVAETMPMSDFGGDHHKNAMKNPAVVDQKRNQEMAPGAQYSPLFDLCNLDGSGRTLPFQRAFHDAFGGCYSRSAVLSSSQRISKTVAVAFLLIAIVA